jgi:hypothetical protein
MFEGDSANMWAGKYPIMPMGADAEGLACADPGLKTPIGVSDFFFFFSLFYPPCMESKTFPLDRAAQNYLWLQVEHKLAARSYTRFSKK